ncbi:hypothetical protein [Haliea sp. E17]|uniref:hypothetical protein n=1 Tax=Haliea sp. E17 TaxID=3401576 RepID=UPI003AAC0F3B
MIHSQYLAAMGIDTYVARWPLPGAAPSRVPVAVPLVEVPEDMPGPQPGPPARREPVASRPPAARDMPRIDLAEAGQAAPTSREPAAPVTETVHFSLAAIFAGDIAWVEVLDGNPLAREQVQLVAAMARALRGAQSSPQTTQFDWPTHSNRQLDRGLGSARDALAAFLGRHLETRNCRHLVMLGEACARYIDVEKLPGTRILQTCSTLDMLAEPRHKRQVWQDLRKLAGGV